MNTQKSRRRKIRRSDPIVRPLRARGPKHLGVWHPWIGTARPRHALQLVEKSEVVRKSFKELQGSGARARPSIFVADRPKPAKAAKRRKLEMPTNAYK